MKWRLFPIIGSLHGPGADLKLDFFVVKSFNAMKVMMNMANGIRKLGIRTSMIVGR